MQGIFEQPWTFPGNSPIPGGMAGARAYLEARLEDCQENNFYTGFSGDIDSGGIFVSTYDVKPVDTRVAVRVGFPGGDVVSSFGVVEWVREYNPHLPDMAPGMGVRLTSLDGPSKKRINAHMRDHPALFFEPGYRDVDSMAVEEKASERTRDRVQDLPGTTAHVPGEEGFYKGLARDVESYLKTISSFGSNPVSLPVERKPRLNAGVHRAACPVETIAVKIVNDGHNERQFQGGFTIDDAPSRVFVSTYNPRRIGDTIRILIRVPDGWNVRAQGRVRWVRRYNPLVSPSSAPPGMGICLTDVSPTTWQNLARHIPRDGGYLTCEVDGRSS
ncbi:MAG: hypothetical protein GY854_15405 [Deltaproteobacteria bacterium]|nr:hypothetical protein [Deltaproteobacteria bacterium]